MIPENLVKTDMMSPRDRLFIEAYSINIEMNCLLLQTAFISFISTQYLIMMNGGKSLYSSV